MVKLINAPTKNTKFFLLQDNINNSATKIKKIISLLGAEM